MHLLYNLMLQYFHLQNIHKYDQRLLYNKYIHSQQLFIIRLYNCSPSMAKRMSFRWLFEYQISPKCHSSPLLKNLYVFLVLEWRIQNEQALHNSKYVCSLIQSLYSYRNHCTNVSLLMLHSIQRGISLRPCSDASSYVPGSFMKGTSH